MSLSIPMMEGDDGIQQPPLSEQELEEITDADLSDLIVTEEMMTSPTAGNNGTNNNVNFVTVAMLEEAKTLLREEAKEEKLGMEKAYMERVDKLMEEIGQLKGKIEELEGKEKAREEAEKVEREEAKRVREEAEKVREEAEKVKETTIMTGGRAEPEAGPSNQIQIPGEGGTGDQGFGGTDDYNENDDGDDQGRLQEEFGEGQGQITVKVEREGDEPEDMNTEEEEDDYDLNPPVDPILLAPPSPPAGTSSNRVVSVGGGTCFVWGTSANNSSTAAASTTTPSSSSTKTKTDHGKAPETGRFLAFVCHCGVEFDSEASLSDHVQKIEAEAEAPPKKPNKRVKNKTRDQNERSILTRRSAPPPPGNSSDGDDNTTSSTTNGGVTRSARTTDTNLEELPAKNDKQKGQGSASCKLCGKLYHFVSQLNFHLKKVHPKKKLRSRVKLETNGEKVVNGGGSQQKEHGRKAKSSQMKKRVNTAKLPKKEENGQPEQQGPAHGFLREGVDAKGRLKFDCRCGTSFGWKHQLNRHVIRSLLPMFPFSCKICSKRYSRRDLLRDHMLNSHNTKLTMTGIACTICGEIFNTQSLLTKHRHESHGDMLRGLQLAHTPRPVRNEKEFNNQQRTGLKRRSDPPFPGVSSDGNDVVVRSSTRTTTNTNQEDEQKDRVRRTNTPEINQSANTAKLPKNEENGPEQQGPAHGFLREGVDAKGRLKFYCRCGTMCCTKPQLNRHVIRSLFPMCPFSCKICSNRYSRRDLLKRHMLSSHNYKLSMAGIACNICSEIFRNQVLLLKHRYDSHGDILLGMELATTPTPTPVRNERESANQRASRKRKSAPASASSHASTPTDRKSRRSTRNMNTEEEPSLRSSSSGSSLPSPSNSGSSGQQVEDREQTVEEQVTGDDRVSPTAKSDHPRSNGSGDEPEPSPGNRNIGRWTGSVKQDSSGNELDLERAASSFRKLRPRRRPSELELSDSPQPDQDQTHGFGRVEVARGGVKHFFCKCERSFSNRSDLNRHVNRSACQGKPLKCSLCPNLYLNMDALRQHTRLIHEFDGPLKLVCSGCGELFPTFKLLVQHFVELHNDN